MAVTFTNYIYWPVIDDSDEDPGIEAYATPNFMNEQFPLSIHTDSDGVRYGAGIEANRWVNVYGKHWDSTSDEILLAGDYIVIASVQYPAGGDTPAIVDPNVWNGPELDSVLIPAGEPDERTITVARYTMPEDQPDWLIRLANIDDQARVYGVALIAESEYNAAIAEGYEPSDLIVSGSTEREGVLATWNGDPFQSSTAVTLGAATEPEEPEEPEEPARADIFDVSDLTSPVTRLLNMPEGYQEDVAREVCSVIASMAYAYTRGAAFTETETGQLRVSKPVVRHVIISAATRLMANPTGLAYRAGSESITTAFTGWTIGERESLNLYRKRWA